MAFADDRGFRRLLRRQKDPIFPATPPPLPSQSQSQTPKPTKKKTFASAALRGLGCVSSSSSSAHSPAAPPLPAGAAVRSAAEWQGKRSRRRRAKQQKKKDRMNQSLAALDDDDDDDDDDDIWCSSALAGGPVDCLVSHRPVMAGRGGRHEAERIHREIMMFQSRIMSGGMHIYDRYKDWRLDVDRMSYEELLELGDKIGYVSTGLREEEITCSLRKMKHSIFDASPLYFSGERERKCSICQEEYEANDEMGKLECGHSYHVYCIKQWLLRKNACPVCKTAVTKT